VNLVSAGGGAVQTEFSLAELLSEGVPIEADEAVSIVHRLVPYAAEHPFGVFPSLDDVYLTPDGVRVGNTDAPVPPGRTPVAWLATTLHALLAYSDAAEASLPLGLQFLISRACGHRFGHPREPMETGAFRPFATLDEFVGATAKFLPQEPDEAITRLYERARVTVVH
jgi:hypothetical protein